MTDAACGVTPTDSSQTYIIVTSIFLAIAVLFYLMRLYVRPPFTPGFRIDDGIMLVATVRIPYHMRSVLQVDQANKFQRSLLSSSQPSICKVTKSLSLHHKTSKFLTLGDAAAHLGLGKDIWNVPPDNIDIVLKVRSSPPSFGCL